MARIFATNCTVGSISIGGMDNFKHRGSFQAVPDLGLGTHRGHNKVFPAIPRTPSSASVFL
jgi:hypothetical protein